MARWLWWTLLVLLRLGTIAGFTAWYKIFREEPQPDWVTATPEMRFKYGSIGAENEAGIPYWIFYVLPRMFPEKLPGPGGYASRSEEHTSELQSLMRISYAVFCLKKKTDTKIQY